MSDKKSDPHSVAIWLLRHFGAAGRDEALTGDLVESFREGRTGAGSGSRFSLLSQ